MPWILPLLTLLACVAEAEPGVAAIVGVEAPVAAAIVAPPAPDPFAAFLAAPHPVADGFAAPFGRGWTACGDGCGTSSGRTPLLAWADGRVVEVGPAGVVLGFLYYENHERRELTLHVEGLVPDVAAGATLRKGQPIGIGARVQLRVDGTDEAPEAFAAARPSLAVPQAEPVLALVHHDTHEMRVYREDVEVGRFAVSFGQAEGAKERRGDNRTPKGVYYVVQRSTGPFGGDYGAYYGGIWIRINYPNAWDAARGVDEGLLTVDEQVAITRAWRARGWTNKNTALGGGIGVHGWASEWSDDGSRNLSWGCIVVHLSDATRVYELLTERAMVVLF